MQEVWLYSIVSVLIVSAISLIGIATLAIRAKLLQNILLYFVSFSAGALFGDVFIHLLPEMAEESGFTFQASISILLGIILFFIVEKIIRQHRHHLLEVKHKHKKRNIKPFALMNLLGDAMHNFMDGLIIGGSYLVSVPVGIGTTLAVIFHEIPQEIGDFGVLLEGGLSRARALWFNFMTALTAIFGVVVALVLSNYVEGVTAFLIPFTAGGFIYIAGSDLLPELLHQEEDAGRLLLLLTAFALGVLVMAALLLLENGHGAAHAVEHAVGHAH